MERILQTSVQESALRMEGTLRQQGVALLGSMLELSGCKLTNYIDPNTLTQNTDNSTVSHLINTAKLAIDYVGPNPDIDRAREFFGYPANLLFLSLTGKLDEHFVTLRSPQKKTLFIVGKEYLKQAPLHDMQLGRLVLPSENIAETMRVVDTGDDTFNCLLFVAKEDENNWPIQEGGQASWKMINTKANGAGSVFCDDPKIKLGVVYQSFYKKNKIRGVQETLGEETYWWHFWATEWSVWKEGLTWARLGRHLDTHSYEQERMKQLLTEQPLKLWNFEDLVYNWRASCRGPHGISALYAYLSGELAFLVLAARKTNDETYDHQNYAKYAAKLEEFAVFARSRVEDYRLTADPKTMLPLLVEWTGFDDDTKLFDYVNSHLAEFADAFLKQNTLIK